MPLSKDIFQTLPKEDQLALSRGEPISKKSFLSLPAQHQEELAGVKREPTPTPGASFANKAANAASFGYLPELVSGAAKLGAPLYEKLTGDKVTPYLPSKEAIKDNVVKELERDSKINPIASGLGDVAGSLASGALLTPLGVGAGLGKTGATAGQKILSAMKAGAIIGGIQNPGETEGKIDLLQPQARLKNAVMGSAVGGAIQGAASAVPAITSALGRRLGRGAERLAETATGATRVQAENFKPGTGRALLDEGAVKFGYSPKNIAGAISRRLGESGDDIMQSLSQIEAKAPVTPRESLTAQMKERAAELLSADSEKSRQVGEALDALAERFAVGKTKSLPITAIEAEKRGMGGFAGFGRKTRSASQEAAGEAYDILRSTVENIGTKVDPALNETFTAAKDIYSKLKPAQTAAKMRATQLKQHPILGLNDISAAGAGLLAGDPSGGVLTAIGRRLVAPRVASSGAVVADKVSKTLLAAPEKLGSFARPLTDALKKSPEAFENTVIRLMQDPEFRRVAQSPSNEEIVRKK